MFVRFEAGFTPPAATTQPAVTARPVMLMRGPAMTAPAQQHHGTGLSAGSANSTDTWPTSCER